MQIIFETPRLYLRQFTEEDAPLILQLNSGPEVIKYVHEQVLENEEQAKNIITNVIMSQYKNNLGRWAIFIKDSNEFIGWCGLKFLADKNEIDLGYRLLQSKWGQGFATEAASHTIGHGFISLHLDIITGKAHRENSASINILKKIGMKFMRHDVEDNCPIVVYTTSNS